MVGIQLHYDKKIENVEIMRVGILYDYFVFNYNYNCVWIDVF